VKAASIQPCYRRSVVRGAARGEGCWPRASGTYARTRPVRLLIATMGGPSWQTVYLCEKHRREAEAAGLARPAPRALP
jgi:hypothetical protein